MKMKAVYVNPELAFKPIKMEVVFSSLGEVAAFAAALNTTDSEATKRIPSSLRDRGINSLSSEMRLEMWAQFEDSVLSKLL